MNTVMVLVSATLTGVLVHLARTEDDRREARRLWAGVALMALVTLGIASIPVLPYLIH
jgi:hypothetical protein